MMRKIGVSLMAGLAVFTAAARAEIPAVGSIAPAFALADQTGTLRRLADWHGQWLVLYFYPKDDTPGCTEQACTFRDDLARLTALGAQVVGVSVDDSRSHQEFARKYHLPFPLLADTRAEAARAYGALADWLVIKVAKRYTFLIAPDGRIAKVYLSVNTSRHSAEIIADLKALQAAARPAPSPAPASPPPPR